MDSNINSTSNPAAAASVVVLYATYEGITSPLGIDGAFVGSNYTQPVANVNLTIGAPEATVICGEAPTEVEGLLQINVRVPMGTSAGNIRLSLKIGNRKLQNCAKKKPALELRMRDSSQTRSRRAEAWRKPAAGPKA